MGVFLLMNLTVFLSAFLLVSRITKRQDLVCFVISLFIFYSTQIIITELFLGVLGKLYLENLLMINCAILSVIYLLTKSSRSCLSFNIAGETIKEIFNHKPAFLLIAIIFVFSAVKLSINLVNPPFGWDSLNYHFTFAVEWFKNANLDIPITIFDDPSPSYYPINGSLFYLWLIFPFKNVFLADLGQLPFFIIGFLALYGIGRKIGLKPLYSFYAASLFTIIPNYFKQLSIAYVDVMVGSLFLACVYYIFILNEKFSFINLLLYSLSFGLFLGVKTISLPYSILLLAPFLFLLGKNLNKGFYILIFIAIVFLLGGFSYLRNYLETANPLYPLNLNIFGKTIFKGAMDNLVYRAHFKIEDYSFIKLLFHEGLGLQTLLFALPGVFLAFPIAIARRKQIPDKLLMYFFLLPIFLYLIYRYIIPLANTRYLYCLLALAIVCGFYLMEKLKVKGWMIDSLVIVSALSSMGELAKRSELASSIVFTLVLFISYIFYKKYLLFFINFFKKPFFLITVIFLLIMSLYILGQDYQKNEFIRYKKMVKYSHFWPDAIEAWEWLNRQTGSHDIAYAGRPVPFPLYGSNFKNNVYYVSVNNTDPVKLHYFPDSRYSWGYDFLSLHRNLKEEGNYRSRADYDVWLRNLSRRNTDYLFVYSLHQTKDTEFPLEDIWAAGHPNNFLLVFKNATIHIYKVIR